MKFEVESGNGEVNVKVAAAEGAQEKLLEAFQECREGRCSCPSQEYSKLDSLEIKSNEGVIQLSLKSKPGETIDEAEISKCLDYTASKVKDES